MSALRDPIESIPLSRSHQPQGDVGVTLVEAISSARHDDHSAAPLCGDGQSVRFILGMPRSGTSWLAKIFDSHPDVIYRHEPDIDLRSAEFPTLCLAEDIASFQDQARAYLQQLVDVRTLKSVGSLPVFAKRYHSEYARYLRAAVIYGLRLAEKIVPNARWPRRFKVPDLIKRRCERAPVVVIKSVSSIGRARLYVEALPASRTIFIIRHPCGQVASMMRGVALGKFEDAPSAPLIAGYASRFGLTARTFEAMPLAEKLGWSWAIMNQKVLDDLSGHPRVRIVRYRDLCEEPAKVARDLLEFSGLSWEPQTAAFIEKSTQDKGADRYYKVLKNPAFAMNRWRTELSLEDQNRIIAVAKQVPAGRMFLD